MSSGAATWLHGQRKTELHDLAAKVGLKDYQALKKSDLETALDEHMRDNQSQLSKDNSLSAFYKRINPSPTKKEKDVMLVETKTPKTSRRATKGKEDIAAALAGESSEAGPSMTLTKTPAKKLSFPANVPLPPSPAVVAEHIDRQAQKVRTSLNKAYKQSGFVEYTDDIRDKISTTASIESLAVMVELIGLQSTLFPFKYLATIPASSTIGTSDIPIKVPDVFVLLTSGFWATLFLWLTTSIAVPMTFAYFFNLTLKSKHGHVKAAKGGSQLAQYDPLTFNITKALVMWLVYGKDVSAFGWPGEYTKATIDAAVPGGYQGALIASGIGALTSIYEAILRR